MKFLRNRTFLAISSLIIGLAVCFVVAPASVRASSKGVPVIQVAKTIPENTPITKDMITIVSDENKNVPANAARSEQDVIGKYVTAELDVGDRILKTKLTDKSGSPYLDNLDGQKQAISISIKTFSAGLSGKLQSGDIVQLFVSGYGDSKQTLAPPELRYVKLLAATTEKGVDTDQTNQQSKKQDDSTDKDNIPSTLTLLVSPDQATKLVDYETNGKLYATLVYRGDKQSAQKYIAMEDDYLNQNQSGTTATSSSKGTATGEAATNGE